jgi:hypothetical protein
MFLTRTIDDILEHSEADTEIIAVLDGAWADPPVEDDPRVLVLHHSEAVGQRAATNEAARLSNAEYVMKVDAHCAFAQGFDAKLSVRLVLSKLRESHLPGPQTARMCSLWWRRRNRNGHGLEAQAAHAATAHAIRPGSAFPILAAVQVESWPG